MIKSSKPWSNRDSATLKPSGIFWRNVYSITLLLANAIYALAIGVLVMIYSDSYMSHDQGYVRFFAYLNLFTASMLGLDVSSKTLAHSSPLASQLISLSQNSLVVICSIKHHHFIIKFQLCTLNFLSTFGCGSILTLHYVTWS
jgi:hypothetical protein